MIYSEFTQIQTLQMIQKTLQVMVPHSKQRCETKLNIKCKQKSSNLELLPLGMQTSQSHLSSQPYVSVSLYERDDLPTWCLNFNKL